MTYAPKSLLDLRRYLMPLTALSAPNLGIVGDAAHAKRSSYHNGKDRMLNRLATDYTAKTARDRAGLTNAASALDIGNHKRLRALSLYLVEQAQGDAPGTSDIRDIIYTPDGSTVLRWDRERGRTSEPRTGEADNSHLFHTHISYYRDSEGRDKIAPFRPFYETVIPDTSTGDDMGLKVTAEGTVESGILRTTTDTDAIALHDRSRNPLPSGAVRQALGVYLRDIDNAKGYVITEGGVPSWASATAGTFTPDAPTVPNPPDCAAEVAAAVAADRKLARVTWPT